VTEVPLNQQIDELARELLVRADVYPRLIASGRLRQSDADFQNARLRAAIETLHKLQRNAALIRQRCGDLE
jgi:hypothetical protein